MNRKRCSRLRIVVAVLAALAFANQAQAGWYSFSWSFRKTITLNGGLVPAAQANFPVLVSFTDAQLGAGAQASGNDILFTAADGTTKLDHQIESYTSPAGKLVAWVRVPALASPANTAILIYYGNAAAANQQNPTGVWDASFRGVWHLHADLLDSTSNAANGVPTGTANASPAQIADGQAFNGIGDSIQTPSVVLQTADSFTVSTWFKANQTIPTHLLWEGDGVNGNGWGNPGQEMHLSLGTVVGLSAVPNFLSIFLGDIDNPANPAVLQAEIAFTDKTAWHQAAGVITNLSTAPLATLYLDGVAVASDGGTAGSPRLARGGWTAPLRFGRPGQATRFFDGSLDEVRISDASRSPTWIQTEYNNLTKQGVGAGLFILSLGAQATAVELQSFEARGADGAVDLAWTTASELHNLGFHLYRSLSVEGPFERITASLIPGLGSSVSGQDYSYRDAGLPNGIACFYKLEDVDTSGVTTLHGPVSATPAVSAPGGGEGSGRLAHGDPSENSLTVLESDARHALVELRTGGFFSRPNPDGTVEIAIPGFESTARPGAPDLPTRSTWIDAIAGRRALVTSVQALDTVVFSDLRPAPAGTPDVAISRDGATVRPTRLHHSADPAFHRGFYPRSMARIVGTGFQQETKKAHLQLSPLRWNASTEQLLFARRLLVRIDFTGAEPREISLGGSRGFRPVVGPRPSRGAIQLLTRDKGLYRVSFEDVFPARRYAVLPARLHLSRQGEPVPFFVDRSVFGPGASLYFLSNGAALNPNADHATYELARTSGGLRMTTASAPPSGLATSFSWRSLTWEQNKTYQAGLLDAPDLWLWEVLISPVTKSHPFTIDQLASTSEPARLSVDLQGGSDFAADPDHHVRLYVNGAFVGETWWDGKLARTLAADVPSGLLLDGANTLQIENVGDTAADYSFVFLDRFSLSYPRLTSAAGGVFEGTVSAAGIVDVAGLGSGSILVDTTDAVPRWLTGATPSALGMAFRAETGRSYLAVSPEAVLRPEVRVSAAVNLRATMNRADYLLIGPREFLSAARSLTSLRQSQGLRTKTVALEDVYDQFGFGEAGPQAVKAFLAYAYHSWQKPSPRYVLLLGDASYDPKNFLKSGTEDRLPTPITKTTFIWTASDPSYALVNGDDLLPDLAIGRLPAASLAEAQILVDKVLAFEEAHRDLTGPAVLVADNEDEAGPFEKNADEIASLLPGNPVEKLYLRDLAAQGKDTRTAIRNALDDGASLMSYVGHGSIAVWASENIWNNLDVNTLKPQPQQPILLTLDCLNGFFHFPPLNSLTEQMVKAEGKGAIAAVSPSGLSLDEPAHVFHKALVKHLLSGANVRLGDAFLAAQADYATSGAFPELLAIYHLFGDPAMKVH